MILLSSQMIEKVEKLRNAISQFFKFPTIEKLLKPGDLFKGWVLRRGKYWDFKGPGTEKYPY
jgi:hypothetical protein